MLQFSPRSTQKKVPAKSILAKKFSAKFTLLVKLSIQTSQVESLFKTALLFRNQTMEREAKSSEIKEKVNSKGWSQGTPLGRASAIPQKSTM